MAKYNNIIITRNREDFANTAPFLEDMDMNIINLPLTEIVYNDIDNSIILNAENIVITSRKSLDYLLSNKLLNNQKLILIGEDSFKIAEQYHQKSYFAGDDGKDLLAYLKNSGLKKILYLRPKHMSCNLKKNLPDLEVAEIMLYEAKELDVQHDFQGFIHESSIILFFSCRHAKIFCKIVRDQGMIQYLKNMMAICLSKNIANELNDIGFNSVIFCEKPNMNSIINLTRNVVKYDKKNEN